MVFYSLLNLIRIIILLLCLLSFWSPCLLLFYHCFHVWNIRVIFSNRLLPSCCNLEGVGFVGGFVSARDCLVIVIMSYCYPRIFCSFCSLCTSCSVQQPIWRRNHSLIIMEMSFFYSHCSGTFYQAFILIRLMSFIQL